MPSFSLSKSRILAGLQCPKRLWLQTHQRELAEITPATQAAFDTGHRVGEVARTLFPGGVLIGNVDNIPAALAETKAALRNGQQPVFEAAFSYRRVLIRADILLPGDTRHRLIEVKSSTGVKDYHLDDSAIQAWVTRGAGIGLERVELAVIDTTFVYQGDGDYRGLFRYADVTDAVAERAPRVPGWVRDFSAMLGGPMPEIGVDDHCTSPFECPFLAYCSRDQPEYPVSLLPRGGRVVEELLGEGIEDLRDIPAGRLEKALHERVRRATVEGKPHVDPDLAKLLGAMSFPRYYLDFESANLAVPIWKGTRPYEHLPFQWSCHVERRDGSLDHREFLDASGAAPMRGFAESLLQAVGTEGPIVVYGAFEKTVLKSLADRCPDLAPALERVIERLFDLLPVLQRHYYHPAMRGSWSIKAVLPTVAPELAYEGLELVQDGIGAQQAFAELVQGAPDPERARALTEALRTYCQRDTLALWTLTQRLSASRR